MVAMVLALDLRSETGLEHCLVCGEARGGGVVKKLEDGDTVWIRAWGDLG